MRIREAEQDVENYLCFKIGDDGDASNYSIGVGRTIGQSSQEKA